MDIIVILNQIVQLLLIMTLGYFLMKKGLLNDDVNQKLNYIVLSVAMPCLIISSIFGQISAEKFDVLNVLLIGLITYLVLPIFSFILVKILRIKKSRQGLFMFMTIFSNTSFMGFPIINSLFGDTGVFYLAIFNMIFNIEVFTLGVILMKYGKDDSSKLNFKSILSPGVIVSVLALFIYFFDIYLPEVFINTCSTVGSMTTPLAMILFGAFLSKIKIKELFSEKIIYLYVIIKQIILPLLIFPLIYFFIEDYLIRGVTMVNLIFPVGSSAVLFCIKYGNDSILATKVVFLTTLLSVFTIPIIVSIFL